MEYLLSPVPGVTVPSAPLVALAQVAGQPTHLAVSWTEPYNGGAPITDYDVRYKKSFASTWTTWSHSGAARSTTITGREPGGVAYDVQVRAQNRVGEGLWSASATGGTGSQAPHAPGAPSVSAASSRSLSVSWAAPYDGGEAITDYDVRYKKGTSSTWISRTHTGTGRTTTISSLSSSTSYDVQIRAVNTAGVSPWGDSGSGSTSAAPPPPPPPRTFAPRAPGAPSVSGSTGRIDVSWSAPFDGGASITRYGVRFQAPPSAAWRSKSHSGTSTSTSFTGLAPGSIRYVQVRARNENGWSPWSSSGSGNTPL